MNSIISVENFYTILNNPIVKNQVSFLLNQGKSESRFSTFFGINYYNNQLVSIKLYFTFFDKFPDTAFNTMGFSDNVAEIVKKHWKPVTVFDYNHKGFTLALKCYIKQNGEILINPYLGFRSETLPFINPKQISLLELDKVNPVGICVEKRENNYQEIKNYYYLSDLITIKTVFKQFGIESKFSNKVSQIEYTESDLVQKMNITFNSSEATKEFIYNSPNKEIEKLSLFFFEKFKWYYYAPGVRRNSETKAIYFIPKRAHYELCQINLIEELYAIK